jgi:hypothetical protein
MKIGQPKLSERDSKKWAVCYTYESSLRDNFERQRLGVEGTDDPKAGKIATSGYKNLPLHIIRGD